MSRDPLAVLLEKLSPDLKAKVGDFLMGQDADLMSLQTKDYGANYPEEEDTPWEQKLYWTLKKWAEASNDKEAKYFASLKSDLDKLKKEFPTIMQPPAGKLAYRGTMIKVQSIVPTIQKTINWTFVRTQGEEFALLAKIPYTPTRVAQSWSVDKSTAVGFGNDALAGQAVGVVYVGKINEDFILNPQTLGAIGEDEKEVIRIASKGVFQGLLRTSDLISCLMAHRFPKSAPFFEDGLARLNKETKKQYKSWDELGGGYNMYKMKHAQDLVSSVDLYVAAANRFFRSKSRK